MGRSKFPGKPSKLATKKRIRILSSAAGASALGQNGVINYCEQHESIPASSPSSSANNHQDSKCLGTTSASNGGSSPSSSPGSCDAEESASAEIKPAAVKKSVKISAPSDDDAPKKKSVSFKSTLETSDDRSVVKKVYNPDNKAPLVPIIKRKCLNRLNVGGLGGGKSTCIVRPSRLTDVLKNGSNGNETTTILKASLFSSAASSVGDGVTKSGESPRKSLYSCRIIKANKRFMGYSKDYLKKLRRSMDGKTPPRHLAEGSDEGACNVDNENDERSSQRPFVLRQPRLKLGSGETQVSESLLSTGPFSFASGQHKYDNVALFGAPAFSGNLLSNLGCDVCKVNPASQITRKFGAYNCEPCRKFISKMSKKSTTSAVKSVPCVRGDGNCVISSDKGKDRCSACLLKACLKTYNLPLKFRIKLHLLLPHTMKIADKAQLDGFHKKIKSSTIAAASLGNASPSQTASTASPVVSESSNLFASAVHSTSSKILVVDKNESKAEEVPFKSSISTKSISLPNPLAENNQKFGSQPAIKPNIIDKPIIMSPKVLKETVENEQVVIKKEEIKQEKPSPTPIVKKERVIKEEVKSENASSSAEKTSVNTPDAKRQKIMLKGPRVKHVCRSASIALGQPLATFGEDEKIDNQCEMDAVDTKELGEENLSGKENKTPDHELIEPDRTNTTPASDLSSIEPTCTQTEASNDSTSERRIESRLAEAVTSKPFTRKYQVRPTTGGSNISSGIQKNLNVFMKRQLPSTVPRGPQHISIDFWENYDPAQVSRNGFGIIATESFVLHPLCFLCGSAGSDDMLFCTCCCEPYHTFCLDDIYNNKSFVTDSETSGNCGGKTINRLNWLCPRCTCCYTCNMTAGPKVRCQKCEKYFHSTCLGISKRLHRTDRPSICSNCLKCKSCGSTNVSKFVGNLPHCIGCFKLRQKGSFCPVCQKCYENDNLELKMMECGACKRWIHARCESLSDEQYNMLSILPEHIEFICRKCAKTDSVPSVWRDAVSKEFNGCLLSVIKQLSKSREACALLKLSPRKKNFVVCAACQPLHSSKAIGFEGEDSNKKTVVPETKCMCATEIVESDAMSLIDVKQKIAKQQYHSVQEFHYDMNLILQSVDSTELCIIYKEIISEIFPWFQNETKACTDALEESMYDSSSFDLNASDEESIQQVPVFGEVRNDMSMDDFWTEGDSRWCVLCRGKGEADNSRFLYCGQNSWIHANCALYSAEVFEEIDGSLQNVYSAINRGKLLKCSMCANKGATVGCNVKNCGEHYHFPCARIAGCLFLNNQTTLCPLHKGEAAAAELALDPNTINPQRPVYVELDRKRKKLVDPSKIRFYLGSLAIERLGRIIPTLSDSGDAIVPSDFQCTRLYWSTQEPWKIVRYSIKTTVHSGSGSCGSVIDNGRNFTVNHSLEAPQIQASLQEITRWHISLNQEAEDMSEEVEEEPQNNADLLPPEIKDAIFEDLPHDMLNSISMLDIFSPKLMTEDYPLSSADVEQLKDSIYNDSNDSFRFEEFSNASSTTDFLGDAGIAKQRTKKMAPTSSATTTCNINWNITTSKKRKINHKLQEIILPMKKKENESLFSQLKISQLDGSCDLPIKRKKIGRRRPFKISQLDGIHDHHDHVLTQMMPATTESHVTCERCRCTYRTQESFERHLANCDVVSTSDSEPPDSPAQEVQTADIQTFSLNINGSNANPFGATFPMLQATAGGTMNLTDQQNAINIAANYITNSRGGNLVQTANGLSIHQPTNFGQNVILTAAPPTTSLAQQINAGGQIFTTSPMHINGFQQQAISLPFSLNQLTGANVITTPLSLAASQPQYEASKTQQIVQQAIVQNNLATQSNKMLIPANNRKQVIPRLAANQSTGLKGKAQALKPATTIKKEAIQVINSLPLMQASQAQNQGNVMFHHQQNAATQPLMLQAANTGLQNTAMMQYVTLPGNGSEIPAQYLTTSASPFITTAQGTFQIQSQPAPDTNAGGILVANGQGGLSMIPISTMQQPQVIGTLIQPQAFQMGAVMATSSAEHMTLAPAPTPTLEMVTDPSSGLMYLASQPVYYGLETIVQNTVMSSQQFVSTAVQNVCQNATFSATTTQVFQTSKIEPIVDLPPGYMVLNNDGNPANAIMPAPQTPAIQQATTYLQQITPSANVQEVMHQQKIETNTTKEAEVIQMIKPQPIQLAQPVIHKQPKAQLQIQKPKPVVTTPKTASIVKPKIIAKPVLTKTQQPAHEVQVEKPIEISSENFKLNIENSTVYICDSSVAKDHHFYSSETPQQFHLHHQQKQVTVQQPPQFHIQPPHYPPPSTAPTATQPPAPSTIILPPTNTNQQLPTNIVNPIQQNCNLRPTNRVLPMQTFVEKAAESKVNSPEITCETPDISIDLIKTQQCPISKPIVAVDNFDQLENEFNNSKMMENVEKVNETINKLVSAIDEDIFMDMQASENKKQQMVEEVCNTIQKEILAKSPIPKQTFEPFKVQDALVMSPEGHMIASPASHMSSPVPHHVSSPSSHHIASPASHHMTSPPHLAQIHLQPAQAYEMPPCSIKQQEQMEQQQIECHIEQQRMAEQQRLVDQEQQEQDRSRPIVQQIVEEIRRKEVQLQSQKENVGPSSSSNNVELVSGLKKTSMALRPNRQLIQRSNTPKILYEIQSQDGFSFKSSSVSEIWEKVFESVQMARKTHGLKALPDGPLSEIGGLNMLGLRSNAIRYLVEQLPGAEKCSKYSFKYHKNRPVESSDSQVPSSLEFEEFKEHKYEVARCIPYSSRSEYDMFSWLASRHRKQPTPVVIQNNDEITIPRRGSGSNLPIAMRYRNLQKSPKDYVGVYRSSIHGRGLFCTRDIEAGEMVIEYAGELIRSTLTDKRERFYDSKGIGCYMFKIDENFVVDATMRGNAARFINHSCDPNCYSKVVDILGHKHIIIFALRRIVQGEELTYDYKFPLEDVKIPCSCGAKRCKKYLN